MVYYSNSSNTVHRVIYNDSNSNHADSNSNHTTI